MPNAFLPETQVQLFTVLLTPGYNVRAESINTPLPSPSPSPTRSDGGGTILQMNITNGSNNSAGQRCARSANGSTTTTAVEIDLDLLGFKTKVQTE